MQLGFASGTAIYSAIPSGFVGNVRIYALPGGGQPVKLLDEPGAQPAFAVANGLVYFEKSGTLQKVPIAGGAPVSLSASVRDDGAVTFAADSANVYWGQGAGVFAQGGAVSARGDTDISKALLSESPQ